MLLELMLLLLLLLLHLLLPCLLQVGRQGLQVGRELLELLLWLWLWLLLRWHGEASGVGRRR